MRISDWSSDVCSSDLAEIVRAVAPAGGPDPPGQRQAGGDPTPLREIGLHHRQAPFDQCRVEGGIAHQVLAGGQRDRRRLAQRPPLRPRPVRAQRLLQPVQAERRSAEHTSELQSLMRISYAVFCLKKKNTSLTN